MSSVKLVESYKKQQINQSRSDPLKLDLKEVRSPRDTKDGNKTTVDREGTTLTTVTVLSVTKYVTVALKC